MKYEIHRKDLSELYTDVVGAISDDEGTNKSLFKLFREDGKLYNDLKSLDDERLLGQMERRAWEREDFDTDLEYLVASTTEGPLPLEAMAYRLCTYETGVLVRVGQDPRTREPKMALLRLHLLAVVDSSRPFEVWLELTKDLNSRGKVKSLHGWRKKKGGER